MCSHLSTGFMPAAIIACVFNVSLFTSPWSPESCFWSVKLRYIFVFFLPRWPVGPRLMQMRELGFRTGANSVGAGWLSVGKLREFCHSHRHLQPQHSGKYLSHCRECNAALSLGVATKWNTSITWSKKKHKRKRGSFKWIKHQMTRPVVREDFSQLKAEKSRCFCFTYLFFQKYLYPFSFTYTFRWWNTSFYIWLDRNWFS